MNPKPIRFLLNGVEVQAAVEPRLHAIDFLREHYELSSPRVGCEHGACGACTIRVDGQIVRGCLLLAVRLDGRKVETLEGLCATGEIADLQQAFHERNAMQCGYCTSGMLMASEEYLQTSTTWSREGIREHLSGNYCRCTGYEAIVDAVAKVAVTRGLKMQEHTS
ncbi:MAG: (2Fe-2S)-binding protein [Burkholderiaceae bacterium]|nr:(2Fe-2S)-binding protein [Burkholderiaceae bacterium]